MKIRREEHMAGGNGHVIIKEILDAEQLNGKCGLYAQVTLEPGCSLGYHEHHGESETYYILQGQSRRQICSIFPCQRPTFTQRLSSRPSFSRRW